MIPLWPLVLVIAVGIILTAALLVGPRLFPGTRPTTRGFWCPFQRRDVGVEFREAAWDGRLVDVGRCTYFSPPTAVTCSKDCLRLGQFPPLRGARTPDVQSVASPVWERGHD